MSLRLFAGLVPRDACFDPSQLAGRSQHHLVFGSIHRVRLWTVRRENSGSSRGPELGAADDSRGAQDYHFGYDN